LYHPSRDPLAISRIATALEPLGLVNYVACTSSYSQGLHLYFPFEIAQNSWQLAVAVTTLLENQGFKCQPGQLEVFPNPKLYVVNGTPNLFNGHRLPLQTGSYLLNDELEPTSSSQLLFVHRWLWCKQRNEVAASTVEAALKQKRRQQYRVSQRADKFLNDLNAEIEPGWTGKGQTNYLLGRITMRTYVFHHVLYGGNPLDGDALVNEIVSVATSLPGYQEWCGHQHEIDQRAAEWARCIENSHYFPYGTQRGKYKAGKTPVASKTLEKTWNDQRAQTAQEKIQLAMVDLLTTGDLPDTATTRFKVLVSYGIGGGTLYKYKSLWHPEFWLPPQTPLPSTLGGASATAPPTDAPYPTSLLSTEDSNTLPCKDSSDSEKDANGVGVRNGMPPATWQGVMQELKERQIQQKAAVQSQKEAQRLAKAEAATQKQLDKVAEYLRSGDYILVKEGLEWLLRQEDVSVVHLLPEDFQHWPQKDFRLAPLVEVCKGLLGQKPPSAVNRQGSGAPAKAHLPHSPDPGGWCIP
jgi:hypothetical protein